MLRLQKIKFALLIACVISFAACKGGPKVSPCVSDPASGGFQCTHPDESESFLPYSDSENYVAFSPDDISDLIDYCGTKQ